MTFRTLIFLFLAAVAFAGCNPFDELNDLKTIDYEAEYALPLINTSLSLEDVLEKFQDNSTLFIDTDGTIRFRYSGDVITKTSDEVFAEVNRVLSQYPVIPVLTKRQALPFSSPDGLQMDRLDLKAGKFAYAVRNHHPFPVRMTLRLPQVAKNGVSLSYQISLNAFSGTGDPPLATNAFVPTEMNGYRIIPENDSLYIEYEAFDPNNNPVNMQEVFVFIQDLDFYYAEGYLGNQLYEGGRDTIEIDFFDQWVKGDIYFSEPRISINFINSFGIPTRSVVNVFNILTVKGEVLPLQSSFISNGIDFPYPSLSEVGKVKTMAFDLTPENSNIDAVLGSGPVAIDYDINAFTNPDNNTSIRGFITDSSYYKVQVEVDLPLRGKATNFIARDTFEIDFSTYRDVNAAEFKIVTDNGLPLSVDIQGYFISQEGAVLDSLLDGAQRLIAAAPVDGNGEAIQPAVKVSFVDFPAERFSGIKNAERMILVASFSTTNEGQVPVRVPADKKVDIRIGAILTVSND